MSLTRATDRNAPRANYLHVHVYIATAQGVNPMARCESSLLYAYCDGGPGDVGTVKINSLNNRFNIPIPLAVCTGVGR